MRRQNVSNQAGVVIFWGSLWGLAEATLGTLLHSVPWVAGFFMFPIGFYFMRRAYRGTGRLSSIFLSASIAATIKLTGLILPLQAPVRVINPAISILIEGLAVLLFFKIFDHSKDKLRFQEIVTAAVGWRLIFLGYHLLLLALSLYDGILQLGWDGLFRFVILDSLVNSGVILLFLKIEASRALHHPGRTLRPGLVNSLLLFVVAVFCELLI